MTANSNELDRAVLEAVSEDYQSFESVVSRLSPSNADIFGITNIERVLLSSIAAELVAAYIIHADPPYATEVGANLDNIRRYWFCITEEGREYLGTFARKQTTTCRRDCFNSGVPEPDL